MKTLDALISYLLEEVALCGKQGAGQSEVTGFVNAFYAKPSSLDKDEIVQPGVLENTDAVVIDQQFQALVWKWLVSHPECRVGSHGQGGNLSHPEVKAPKHALQRHAPAQGEGPQAAHGEVRIYANEERMWHALTGHGVDYSKIPSIYFKCLSVIAAAGPKGIMQSELVKLSDQDKRSVPRRTQDLFEKGYITKIPILSGSARTSLCMLKRFDTTLSVQKTETDVTGEEPDGDIDSQVVFNRCFPDGGANLYVLLRNIFDLLNRFRIITLEDLRRRLGVRGHRWERRVLAATLRKLEAVGCVKQVKARAHGLGDGSKYFRCLKIIREPGENESQQLCGVSHVNLRSTRVDQTELSESESDGDEGDQAAQSLTLSGIDNRADGASLQELKRPIAQWTGSGCINNLLYDLVWRAGRHGLSSMDIKDQSLGRFVSRPIENQLARIVDHWQVAQPAHLRHLAIIRDTAMGKKSTHYIHYTFDHFKKLVENGESSWEAVSVVRNDSQNRPQPALAMDATFDLDEYGFPNIPHTLFQGHHRDATVSQCAKVARMATVLVSRNDPVVQKLSDGTYEVHHAPTAQRKFSMKPVTVRPSVTACTSPRSKGRPRKKNQIDLVGKSTMAQNAKQISSQKAALRYQKNMIEKEIARRIGTGEDPNHVREDIFAIVSAKHMDAGEDIPASIKELRVHNMTLSGAPVVPDRMPVGIVSSEKQIGESLLTSGFAEYLPSVAAHTQAVIRNKNSSFLISRGSTQASTRPLKRFISPGHTERVEKVPIPDRSSGLTYDEQSNLIKRGDSGVYIGANASRARLPGQRGRSRRCRLAIFKSPRLSDLAWFTEWKDGKSTSFRDETQHKPSVLSSRLPVSNRSTQIRITSSSAVSSDLLQAETNHKHTLEASQIPPSSNQHQHVKMLSTESTVLNEVHMSDSATGTDSHITSPGDQITFGIPEVRFGSHAVSEEKYYQPSKSPPNISHFTAINQRHSSYSIGSASGKAALHVGNAQCPPSKNLSETPVSDAANIDEEERILSHSKSPILTENNCGADPREEKDSADHETKKAPAPPAQALPVLKSSLRTGNGNVTGGNEEPIAAAAHLTKPVTITGGSVSMLRKNIVMDIMQMCGGIYSGHRELIGPFLTAWSKQNKPGTPDSRTVYKAFRALVQAGKLRELKFSFQTRAGLMVTKSMITLSSISPTDPRVVEMQQLIKNCHPSPYIPEGAENSNQTRIAPVPASRWKTNRALADLEIDDENEVRLQHIPSYVTRWGEGKMTAKRNRQAKQERLEAIRANHEERIQQARQLKYSTGVELPWGIERLASIRRPAVRYNQDSLTKSSVGIPGIDLTDADPNFTYVSSEEVEHTGDEMAGNGEEDSLPRRKRTLDLSDRYETGEITHITKVGENKRRRLTAHEPIMPSSERLTCTLRPTSTLMDPQHIFHVTTGTFSVTFSGFKTLNAWNGGLPDTAFGDQRMTNFNMEVEKLLRWELALGDFSSPVYPDRSFINYPFLHSHLTAGKANHIIEPNFKIILEDQRVRKSTKPTGDSPVKKDDVIAKALDAENTGVQSQPRRETRKRRRTDSTLKTRRVTALGEANALADFGALERATQPNGIATKPAKLRRIRGPQNQVPMTRDEEERLLAAVIAVRTITGGVEKNPDWVLVTKLFQPEYNQLYIQKKWAQVQQRYRLQLNQIQANFQIQFIKAYEDNTIPAIDFDHLEDYDWAWLVEWTLDNIDTSWDSLQHLPSKRSELDRSFDLTASKGPDMSDFFGLDTSVTWERREAVLNKIAYVSATQRNQEHSSNASSTEVAIARTWIRANIITSAASYDPDLARAKLSILDESSVDTALQELLSARLLAQSNKGRLVPGRNYDISVYFLSCLRRKLDVAQLRQGAVFKRILDRKFCEQTSIIVPYEAGNGDMMAILNMLAYGRITVKPKNPPMEKFGLTDRGYRTRQMDKSRMNFDVEIYRSPTYMDGNPIAPLPLPPCQHLDDPMAKIPLWYDIHGQFVPIMWDLLLAATMSMLAVRSCISAAEVERSFRPAAELWEVELLLEWMVNAKAATITGQGVYTVAEWWWLCLANEELDQSSGEKPAI